ncbi:penicillin-binding protein 2 [Ferrithrix thermotolerans DSM 19514]|uniref:Penicillin-binding protein 2 n=2 Tax=Ferrithrix TaxID=643949 RepID=A0A1M4W5W8_9ACTN|nr:penicillin-binding protein 2 [Ferrithrix thermotolerans DSM 19514]
MQVSQDSSSKKPMSFKLRSRLMGFVAAALFVALFARLYALQVLTAPVYKAEAAANQVREVSVPAPRGLILDRNEQVMVGNQVVKTLALSSREAYLHPAVVKRVAQLVGLTPAQVQSELINSQYSIYQPTPIKYNLSTNQAIYFQEHQSEYPGVTIELTTQRTYPMGDTAAQVLGYVGQVSAAQLKTLAKQGYQAGDQIGEAGVEATFQNYLRGRSGVEKLQVNAAGDVVGVLGETKPVPGGNLQLTIDANLEKKAQTILANQIYHLAHSPNSFVINAARLAGSIVVENPNNGSIYAMASYPTYNPSEWVPYITNANYAALTSPSSNQPLINRAIQGEYTPGSTFKLATASAALKDGLISPYTIINDPGYFKVPNCTVGKCSFHNSGYEALGNINIVTALADSDDVFFYTLGYNFYINQSQFGPTPIQNMAKAYGFGQPTGIALPGEAAGIVDSLSERQYLHKLYPSAFPYDTWYAGDNIEMAFGQGMTLITPLQLANAYATFANGGTRYVPRIADGIVNDQGKLIKYFPPKVVTHVTIPAVDRAAMIKGFEGAIQYGTGGQTFAGFPLSQFPLAGKTGTASVAGQAPDSLFVAWGPVNNPQYVISAVVTGGGFGAVGAAPMVRALFTYLMSHPIKPEVYGVPHLSAGSTGVKGTLLISPTKKTAQKPKGYKASTSKTSVSKAG